MACTVIFLIYKHNDSDIYYKCKVNYASSSIVLACATSVTYNRKVCCKLKRIFMTINYIHNTFIVQATGQKVLSF